MSCVPVPPPRHDPRRQAGRGEGVDEAAQRLRHRHLGGAALGVVDRRLVVAVVALHARVRQPVGGRDPLRQRDRRCRIGHARATAADLDVDQHLQRPARAARGVRQPVDDAGVVHRHQQVLGARVERRQAVELGPRDHAREQQDARDPGVDHHLGLGEGRAARADRPGLGLQAGDVRRLVHLRHRAQRVAVPAGVHGHRRDVGLHAVEVEHERRRRQRVPRPRHPDQRLVRPPVRVLARHAPSSGSNVPRVWSSDRATSAPGPSARSAS